MFKICLKIKKSGNVDDLALLTFPQFHQQTLKTTKLGAGFVKIPLLQNKHTHTQLNTNVCQ